MNYFWRILRIVKMSISILLTWIFVQKFVKPIFEGNFIKHDWSEGCLLKWRTKSFSQNVFEKLWKNGFFIFSDFIDHAAHWGRARPLDPILALLTLTGFERLLQNCDYGFAFYSISRIMLFEYLLYLVIYRAQRSIKANQYYKIIFHI